MNKKYVGALVLVLVIAVGFAIFYSDYRASVPSVVSAEALLEEDVLILKGKIIDNGDKEITEYGFKWGISPELGNKEIVGISIAENNTYEFKLSDLEWGKTYYYQAYALNEKGIGIGEMKEITIPLPPNEPPIVNFVKPVNEITVTQGDIVEIAAIGEDDKEVICMELFVNKESLTKVDGSNLNFKWDTSKVKPDRYTIRVTGTDGKESSDQSTVVIVKEAVTKVDKEAQPSSQPLNNNNTPSRGTSSKISASSKYPKLSKVNGAFGQFPYRELSNGRIEIDPRWVAENIVTITLPGLNRQVQVHKEAAENFILAFNYIKNGTAVINGKKVPLLSLIKTMDGTWVPRHVNWNPSKGLSNHSWGTAIDINAFNHFRYVDPAKEPYDPNLILWEKAFKPAGFSWGNRYSDAMHYELYK